jgi:thioredoxin 2
MAPHFASVATQLEPRVRFAKVNTEEEPQLAGEFGIRSIPTMIVFKNGREIARQSGAMDVRSLAQWVNAHAA